MHSKKPRWSESLPWNHQTPLPRHGHCKDLPRVMKEAFHIASAPDALAPSWWICPRTSNSVTSLDVDLDPPMQLPGYESALCATRFLRETIRQVAAAIKLARRPVIYSQAAASLWLGNASEELREFITQDRASPRYQRPIMGIGSVPCRRKTNSMDMAGHARCRLCQLRGPRL